MDAGGLGAKGAAAMASRWSRMLTKAIGPARVPSRRYLVAVDRRLRIPCPPEASSLRLGQRIYFFSVNGCLTVQTRPRLSRDGRLHSSRVKRMTITLARFGPRARPASRVGTAPRRTAKR